MKTWENRIVDLVLDMRDWAGSWVGFVMAFVMPLVAMGSGVAAIMLTLAGS